MSETKKGFIIVVEGLDGCGKNTTALQLHKELAMAHPGEVYPQVLSFPDYTSPTGKIIKSYLEGDVPETGMFYSGGKSKKRSEPIIMSQEIVWLYALDRKMFMDKKNINGVSPMEFYNNGGILVMDRYTSSNILYQTREAKTNKDVKHATTFIRHVEHTVMGLPRPDVVLYLDVATNYDIIENSIAQRRDEEGLNQQRADSEKDKLEKMDVLKKIDKRFHPDLYQDLENEEHWKVVDIYDMLKGRRLITDEIVKQIIEEILL